MGTFRLERCFRFDLVGHIPGDTKQPDNLTLCIEDRIFPVIYPANTAVRPQKRLLLEHRPAVGKNLLLQPVVAIRMLLGKDLVIRAPQQG